MPNHKYTIAQIHKEFVPKYDRWQGKLFPRILSWFSHIIEVLYLLILWNRPYYKHNRTPGTSKSHAWTEFKDWLWLTAEIIWMFTKIELPIVPNSTYERVRSKFIETKKTSNNIKL